MLLRIQNKVLLKVAKEISQLTYKGKSMRVIPDLSAEILKGR
jgi:hypothetical protein